MVRGTAVYLSPEGFEAADGERLEEMTDASMGGRSGDEPWKTPEEMSAQNP